MKAKALGSHLDLVLVRGGQVGGVMQMMAVGAY